MGRPRVLRPQLRRDSLGAPALAMEAPSTVPSRYVYATSVGCAVVAGGYTLIQTEPVPIVALAMYWAPLLAALVWLQNDARRTRLAGLQDWGFFLWLAWPFLVPWYALKTRGRAGWALVARLALLVFAPLLTALIVAVAYALLAGTPIEESGAPN